ncbi:MAG: hypothetical protein JWR75_982 [Devosia sp.]|nr:hypothetical protein [Devosia sp.]
MKQALVVWGGLELHEPEEGARRVRKMLEAEGFAVTVSADYESLAAPDIGRMDLVVPVITGGELDRDKMKIFLAAIEAGTGFAAFHHGMATSFQSSPPFHFAAGVYWAAHPGNVIDYRVEITRPDDPIVAGLSGFAHHSEQYYILVDPTVEVLATTRFSGEHAPWIDGAVIPQVYKKHYGKGRVFYSALGHKPHELDVPEIGTILKRGMLWAAR